MLNGMLLSFGLLLGLEISGEKMKWFYYFFALGSWITVGIIITSLLYQPDKYSPKIEDEKHRKRGD